MATIAIQWIVRGFIAWSRFKNLKEEHKIILKKWWEQEIKEKEAGWVILGLLKKNVKRKEQVVE